MGNFVKLMEQGMSLTSCAGILLLLSNPRRWKGQRVTVIGDYAEDSDLRPQEGDLPASELYYALERGQLTDYASYVRSAVRRAGIASFSTRRFKFIDADGKAEPFITYEARYLDPSVDPDDPQIAVVNHDRNELLSPRLMGDDGTLLGTACHGWDGGTGTALFVLLAASCKGGARGGGDIDSASSIVGSWAGDHISVLEVSKLPDRLCDITFAARDVLSACGEASYDLADDGTVHRLNGQ